LRRQAPEALDQGQIHAFAFVEMIRTVVTRGVESGDFRVAVDPVQLYISIAALLLLSANMRRSARFLAATS
jgi:hypothetical protein